MLSVTDIGGNSGSPPVERWDDNDELMLPDAIALSVCLKLNVFDRCRKPITVKNKLGNAHINEKIVAEVT